MKELVKGIEEIIRTAEDCPVGGCNNSGCYPVADYDDDPIPEQCEFCYTNPKSKFNLATAIANAIELDEEKVIGALARGYCHKENEKKELDSTLLQAILVELSKGNTLKIKGK